MTTASESPANRLGLEALPADLRTDVLDIVSDALQWQLTEARWAEIEGLLTALEETLRSGDREAVEAALTKLELAAPLRIIPIDGMPTTTATARLRNVAKRLVHELGEGLDGDLTIETSGDGAPDTRDSMKDGATDR